MSPQGGGGGVSVAAAEPWQETPPPAEIAAGTAPIIDTEPVPACPVCAATAFDPLTVAFDYELQTCRNPWRFVRCRECGHAWLNPRPAVAALGVIYPPTYYAYNYAAQINPVARRGKEILDGLKLRGVLRHLSRPPVSFLDVGCGDGRYLRLMERRGVPRERLYGLELNDKVVAPLAAAGYRVFNQRIETCTQVPDGSIDLATMFHVIEHIDDPAAVARRVAKLLAPGGVFAVETPNLDSLDARLFRDRFWGGYHVPRHWNLFTPATLTRLLTDAGLEVRATLFQTGHSFWMYSCHHALRYGRTPRPRLARWFDPLKGLPFLVAFTAWDKLRAALGRRTSAMLVLARKPG
jgi:SAM-dependent methyltransferase